MIKKLLLISLVIANSFFSAGQVKKTTYLKENEVQLSPPQLKVDSLLFYESALVQLEALEEATIRYTLNGESVNDASPIYEAPLAIDKSCKLQTKAFYANYKDSETLNVDLRKLIVDISDANISITPMPNDTYKGKGFRTLVDGIKGDFNFRNDSKWLGFQAETVSIQLGFKPPKSLHKVIVSVLQDQGSWIFAPKAIRVMSDGQELGFLSISDSEIETAKALKFIEIPITNGNYKDINVKILSLNKIPDWHDGKGTLPWLFVDEILVE